MSEDKPLHVRVAEALGCKPREHLSVPVCTCADMAHGSPTSESTMSWVIPEYDTDWSATGPLIENGHFGVEWSGEPHGWTAVAWRPDDQPEQVFRKQGSTPLIAVCRLILVLADAGKLPR